MWNRLRRSALPALIVMLIVTLTGLGAQAQSLTGGLVFEVMDTDAKPLPGVSITLESPQLQGFQFRESDEGGRVRFVLLPPGQYTAEFVAEGHVTFRQEVRVEAGSTKSIPIAMTKGEAVEDISVTGEKPIDTTETRISHVYDSEQLQKMQVGSGNRSYQSVLQQAPGVSGGGNPSVHGSTLGENRYLLDGVDSTDPVTGTFGQNLQFDAIEQIDFLTGGFRAENGLATGGLVNVVSKSGGNETHGSVDIRYTDENMIEETPHFSNDLPQSSERIGLTLGGYVKKDKFWYFLSYEDVETKIVPANDAATRTFDGSQRLAKFTWLINPDHRIAFQYTADPADIFHANASPLVAPEAGRLQEQGAEFYTVVYNGRLTDRWSLSVQLGKYESELNSFPMNSLTERGLVDLGTGAVSRNYTNAQYSERNRDQWRWSANYLSGSGASPRWHDIKFGMEGHQTDFVFDSFTPGGGTEYWDSRRIGDPDRIVRVDSTVSPGVLTDDGDIFSVFLQDTWHVNRRTTVDAGLRFDRAQFQNDRKEEIADMSLLQPRIGVAYDVQGDGNHVVRFTATRAMHPGILTIPNAVNERASYTEILYEEAYLNLRFGGDWDCDGNSTPNEVGSLSCLFTSGGPGGSFVDPNGLDPTYIDEITLGYEHAFRPNLKLGGRYVWRDTNDIIEDTCVDDDCLEPYIIKNIPELYRRYNGVELDFSWETSRWHVFANYTFSKSKGNIEYTQGLGVDWDALVHRTNRSGLLVPDRKHSLKLHGWVDLPRKWAVGWDAWLASGETYTMVENVLPYGQGYVSSRGAHRLPSTSLLDVEGRKAWEIGKTELSLIGTIENVLGQNTALSVQNLDGPDFGTPLTWTQPRQLELGLRFTF
jgi:hypothetical protein